MTTLQEDMLTASNQSKPGYDVLGNPVKATTPVGSSSGDAQVIANQQAAAKLGVSIPGVGGSPAVSTTPTTLSGDKSQTIADNTQQVNNIASTPTGNVTGADSYERYSNGDWANAPTGSVASIDENGRTTWQSGGRNYYLAPDTPENMDQTDKQSRDLLDQIRSQTDSAFSAQIASVKAQFDALIKQQGDVNTRQQASTDQTLLMGGTSRYAQLNASGISTAQINYGIQQISDLQTKENSAVATLMSAQADKDYEIVGKQLDLIAKIKADKQKTVNDLNDKLAAAAKDARDFKAKQDQQKVENDLALNQFDYKKSQDIIDNAYKAGTLDETKRHNLQEEITTRNNSLRGVYQRDSDGTIYDTRTGKVVSDPNNSQPIGSIVPGKSGSPIVDANTKTTSTGVPYVDGTNLTGAEATKAQLKAAQLGIPYIGKDGANALNNIEAARNDFKLILDLTKQLNPKDVFNNLSFGAVRLVSTVGHGLENKLQIGPDATALGSYNTFKESAIKAIQALAAGGTGLRINQAEIQTMMDNIPSYNDTKGVAQGKLSKLNAMLTNNEKGIIGSKSYDAYVPEAATEDLKTYVSSSPDHQKQVESLMTLYPTATDSQLMQLVQP